MTTTQTIPVDYILRSAKVVKRLAYLIAVIGTVASYGTQVELLQHFGLTTFAYVIPATVDLLAICAAIALQIPGFPTTDRKIAGTILVVAVIVSVAANVTSGHNIGARLAHAWPVVAYLLAELIANRIRQYVARVQAAQAAAPAPVAPVVDVTPAVAAVTSPAPRRTATAHPSNATRGHMHCTHEATPTARAACRRAAARA